MFILARGYERMPADRSSTLYKVKGAHGRLLRIWYNRHMIKDCQVGVKGIVCTEDGCLVLKSENGYWDIPGGRIGGEETIEETLHRELKEELPSIGGYKFGNIVHAFRLSKNIIDGKGLVLLFYKVEAEKFDVALSSEHQGYRWVTKDTLHELRNADIPIESGYYEAIRRVLE